MFTLNKNNLEYHWLYFQVRIAGFLDTFKISIRDKFSVKKHLQTNIIKHFDNVTTNIVEKTKTANILTPSQAKLKLSRFKGDREFFESFLEISDSSSSLDLKISIKALLKASYRYEARLHKVAFSKSEVSTTPDYIKNQLAELSKESVSQSLHSLDVF